MYRVEFQTKFYSGKGFKFLPFTFESILDGRFEEWVLTAPHCINMSLCSWESVWCLIVIFVSDVVPDFHVFLTCHHFLESASKSVISTQKWPFIHSSVNCLVLVKSFCFTCFIFINIIYAIVFLYKTFIFIALPILRGVCYLNACMTDYVERSSFMVCWQKIS